MFYSLYNPLDDLDALQNNKCFSTKKKTVEFRLSAMLLSPFSSEEFPKQNSQSQLVVLCILPVRVKSSFKMTASQALKALN